MDNKNFGRDQIIINDPTGKISIAESNGSQNVDTSRQGERPPNFERYWVDRSCYQSQLHDRLSTTPVTEIVADGGFGKSSLAAWGYANLRGDFQKRVWVGFRNALTFDYFARRVLQEIGWPNKDPQVNNDGLLRELIDRLDDDNKPVKTLVVLDQLETIADSSDRLWFEQFLSQWAEHGKESRVLVTTRSQILPQASIALMGMDVGEGSAFLTREGLTGDRFSDLITLAKGHPLLLKLAASWTKETYESRVDDRAIDFFDKLFKNYTGDPKAGVSAIFSVIFEALPSALQELLCRVSVYRLPIEGAMAEAMEGTIEDLGILAGQGLLLLQGVDYVLHPLVAGLVRSRVTEEVRRDGHERAIEYYAVNYQPLDGTIESCRSELEVFYHACELGQYRWAKESINRCYEMLDWIGESQSLLRCVERLTREWSLDMDMDVDDAKNLGWALNGLGNLQCDLGSTKLAITNHEKAQKIFDRLDLKEGKSNVFSSLGSAYRCLGEYQKAIAFHSQHNDLSRAIGDQIGTANSLGNLGLVYYELGDYQKAIELHSQHNEMAQAMGYKKGIMNSLGNLGLVYYELGDYQKAIELYSQHNEMAQATGYKKGISISLGNLGTVYLFIGDYQKAIDLYLKSIEIAEAIDDKNGIANSRGNLGAAYQCLGDYQKAIDFHSQSMEIAEVVGYKQGIANSLGNLGGVYCLLSDYKKAINYSFQSLNISRNIGNKKGTATSLNNIGRMYDLLGNYQKAIDFISQSMEISQAIGNKKGIGTSLHNLGLAYDSLGDYEKAIDFYSQSIEIAQAIGSKKCIRDILSSLGSTYTSLGNYSKAIDFHYQSLTIAQAIGDRNGEGGSLCNLGNAYNNLYDYEQAVDFFQKALPIQREAGNRQFEANSLNGLGNTYKSLGDYQKAIDFHSQSMELRQAIGDKAGVASSLFNLSNIYQQRGRLKLSMHYRHQAYRIWQDMNLPLAAAPFPAWTKKLIQSMGDTWAEQLIANDKAMAWLMFPIGYLLFALRILLSPLTQLQTRLKIQPKIFWFCVGIAIVLLIAWLRK